MATARPGVWGIDLGQCALKAIRLEQVDGKLVATAFDYIEHPKILGQPDADPDQLTREALQQFLSRNHLKGDTVVISVPGQSGLARFVKLPPVEEKKIADIVRFEAKQQIPFPLEEVVWDFQKLGSGVVSDGFALETEIGLFAMKRDMISRYLGHFTDVNVEVQVIQMAPLGLCNFVTYDLLGKEPGQNGQPKSEEESETLAKNQCVVVLDIGTDNSNLVITDGDKVIWQRPIPLGGNHFTRALTKDLKLTFAKAEHLKRNAVKSPDLKAILSALKPVLNDFVGEVQRSLGYFTNTHRDAQIEYLMGLGNAFRLPGLQKYLQEKLQLEVRKLHKLERVSGDEVVNAPTFSENILSFGVAYGLALQGLKVTRLQTNLLPQEIRMERMIRAKKPWAAAAAALLLLAIPGMAWKLHVKHDNLTDPRTDAAAKDFNAAKGKGTALSTEYEKQESRIARANSEIEQLTGGIKARDDWDYLVRYVKLALPRPDGSNLGHFKEAFHTKEAKLAYQMLQDRRYSKPADPKAEEKAAKDEEFIKDHLIQVNIEGVLDAYSPDLSHYFSTIVSESDERLWGMDSEQRNVLTGKDKSGSAPKSGWVVEIRGYTYQKDGGQFVKDTFLDNLRPRNAKLHELPPLLEKKMRELIAGDPERGIAPRVGYLFLYKGGNPADADANPQAGQFRFINRSFLPHLVDSGKAGRADSPRDAPKLGKGAKGGKDKMDPKQKGMPGAGQPWEPLGIAGQLLGQKAGGRPGPGPGPGNNPPPTSEHRAKRTEFVILFVWQDPSSEGRTGGKGKTKNKMSK